MSKKYKCKRCGQVFVERHWLEETIDKLKHHLYFECLKTDALDMIENNYEEVE